MTKFLSFIFFLVTTINFAQIIEEEILYYPQPIQSEPCYYTSYTISANGEIENLQTEAIMVEEWTTPSSGRVIDFTLLKTKDDLILLVEIHEDAEDILQPICFGSSTSIELKLKNGLTVKLPQIGPKRCGYVNIADDSAPYYNITNFSYFKISIENAKKLQASEVNLANISSTKYDLDFVFKSELYDEVNDILIYPEFYFISELDCMLNPILPED
ncbi:hypothetical protein [Psychroflexus salis]|uniref:Uncharacterized protein n=1 Tax=Psychroflexus salis TaxID=1526574 RepID=A0A916ZXN3_9FLAO|nr:hypothetical protein [Psychroflexus salis]GGE18170.1 hypothetical protein GCM10010831_19230 [Psychroflexus salis]